MYSWWSYILMVYCEGRNQKFSTDLLFGQSRMYSQCCQSHGTTDFPVHHLVRLWLVESDLLNSAKRGSCRSMSTGAYGREMFLILFLFFFFLKQPLSIISPIHTDTKSQTIYRGRGATTQLRIKTEIVREVVPKVQPPELFQYQTARFNHQFSGGSFISVRFLQLFISVLLVCEGQWISEEKNRKNILRIRNIFLLYVIVIKE